MKVSTLVPALLAAIVGSSMLVGCAVDADDDPDVVTTPGKTDVTVKEDTPDVNIKTETPPSSNTTGGGSTVTTG